MNTACASLPARVEIVDLDTGVIAYAQELLVPADGAAAPAAPNAGEIVSGRDVTLKTVLGLNQPTSQDLADNVGFVVTVTGTTLRVDGLTG